MNEFNPNLTQRVRAAVKRRVTPRSQWKSRAKDISSICLAAGPAALAIWVGLPADLKAHLPVDYVAWGIGAINIVGWFGKFVVQGPAKDAP